MTYYFQVPFGASGDRSTIPATTQVDGSISYPEGYGANYQAPRDTDPAALTIERNKMNQLFYAITSNIQQYQQFGAPQFITSADNGGTAFPYSKYATVRYDDGVETANYMSLINSNTGLPTDTSKWVKIRADGVYLGNANTFTAQQTINCAGTPLVLQSSNSTGAKAIMKDGATTRGAIGATSSFAFAAYLADTTTLVGGWDSTGQLLPGTAATYDIGSASAQWRAAYANRFVVMGSTAPTNGIYLPAANTVGVSANSVLVASFTSTGMNNTPIGATTPSTGKFTTLVCTTATTSLAPVTLPTGGTYLTTPINGAIEFNSKCLAFTPLNSERGLILSSQTVVNISAIAGTNATTAQPFLDKNPVVSSGTWYEFSGIFMLAKTVGTNSHNIDFKFGGTAVISAVTSFTVAQIGPGRYGGLTEAGAWNSDIRFQLNAIPINYGVAFVAVKISGFVHFSTGGSFIPQYILSADPGGSYSTDPACGFKIAPLASSGGSVNVGNLV